MENLKNAMKRSRRLLCRRTKGREGDMKEEKEEREERDALKAEVSILTLTSFLACTCRIPNSKNDATYVSSVLQIAYNTINGIITQGRWSYAFGVAHDLSSTLYTTTGVQLPRCRFIATFSLTVDTILSSSLPCQQSYRPLSSR